MKFHPDVCKVFRITNKLKLIATEYYMQNHKVENVDAGKYLGLIIHTKLSWKPHASRIIKRASHRGIKSHVIRHLSDRSSSMTFQFGIQLEKARRNFEMVW